MCAKYRYSILILTVCLAAVVVTPVTADESGETLIKLPEPRRDSACSLESAMQNRRSVRHYSDAPIELESVSQLLWAAQGTTNGTGFRTAPSAGALFPLEVYVAAGNIKNLARGVYKYNSSEHCLRLTKKGDIRPEIYQAALKQPFLKHAPVLIIMSAVYERTTGKYGQRGIRYIHMEIGHAAQNLVLQAVALKLAGVTVGAFHDADIERVLGLADDEHALSIIAVGKP